MKITAFELRINGRHVATHRRRHRRPVARPDPLEQPARERGSPEGNGRRGLRPQNGHDRRAPVPGGTEALKRGDEGCRSASSAAEQMGRIDPAGPNGLYFRTSGGQRWPRRLIVKQVVKGDSARRSCRRTGRALARRLHRIDRPPGRGGRSKTGTVTWRSSGKATCRTARA